MTAAPEDRKIRQLTNDVLAIYEKLDTITHTQRHHSDRLDGISTQVRRVTAIVERQGNRLDELTAGQEQHTATLAQHTDTLAQHTDTLAQHTATLAQHTDTLAEHTDTLAEHGTKLDRILEILERR